MFSKAKGFLLWLFGWEEPVMSPDEIIDLKAKEMTSNLNRCKVHVARLIKEQRDLQDKIHRNTNQITHHLREARNCMARNEEARAREHLRHKHKHDQIGEKLNSALDKFKGESEKLVDTVRKLEFKLEELKRHKMLLITQKQCYEAQLLLEGHGESDDAQIAVKDVLASMEEEVMAKQARVLLENDIESGNLLGAADTEIVADQDSAAIEAELAEMRSKLTAVRPEDEGPGPGPEGSGPDDIIFIK